MRTVDRRFTFWMAGYYDDFLGAVALPDDLNEPTLEYKSHKIAQRLRDINGQSTAMKIKGRTVRVWRIPAFDVADIELTTPDFKRETPF